MSALAFHDLVNLAGDRLGIVDVPCPACSSIHNPRRKVLRIWREDETFIGFACARCGEKGWARDCREARRKSPDRVAEIRREAAVREIAERAEGIRRSRFLWSRRRPIVPGSPPFNYLRGPRCYSGMIPATLAYLPPAKAEHHHAMIAALGMAQEPEPGVLAIADDAVMAVHLTMLRPDGSDKAGIESAKIIVGRGASGSPICLAPPNDLLGLAITEGIEDALSIHEATGLGAWAAGSASRLPALAASVPSFVDTVTVAADDDGAGLRNAQQLCAALTKRGIHNEMRVLGRRAST
jgi:Toprim domain